MKPITVYGFLSYLSAKAGREPVVMGQGESIRAALSAAMRHATEREEAGVTFCGCDGFPSALWYAYVTNSGEYVECD